MKVEVDFVAEEVMEMLQSRIAADLKVKIEHELKNDLALDSLDMLDLANEVETSFDVILSDDAIYEVKTVLDLIQMVKSGLEE
ncbi:acyl carrier protein [Falsibacillus albus]|uniref:Carrier domain-containing protein n=1 Tax=Falsibacillus albus TaxID=2478915 RepID=A0A3L7JVR1_9BACI|nr:phosphopantetheine-binding protein [Falsibacillus albus]RLQ94836.1 hypothetical protein D9X91_12665 [Falsibacillus albus]